MDYKAPKVDYVDDVKMALKKIDAKVDKAIGWDAKPVHYWGAAIVLVVILSNILS